MITEGTPFSREERILQNQVNPDAMPVYDSFLTILEGLKRKLDNNKLFEEQKNTKKKRKKNKKEKELKFEPVEFFAIFDGGPGWGKTTTLRAVQHTIERVLGISPEIRTFDSVRANFLRGKDVARLQDLTTEQKVEFKQKVIDELVVKPRRGKDVKEPHIVLIEAPCFGDDELGGVNEIERGQSALQQMLQDPNISRSLVIFHVFGTEEVKARAITIRKLADDAKSDWQFIHLVLQRLNLLLKDPVEEDKEKDNLLNEYRQMASPDMIITINDAFDRLALKSLGIYLDEVVTNEEISGLPKSPDQLTEDIERVSLRALAEQMRTNLTEPVSENKRRKTNLLSKELLNSDSSAESKILQKLEVSKVELEMLLARILYSYKRLQAMLRANSFAVVPRLQKGIETSPTRVFNCINQLWRERENN